jgi:hypothetical protein
MVLPIPVVPGSAEDAVRFVNLRGYPRFFVDLHRAFPEQLLYAKSHGLLAAAASRREKLVVHDVGAFVASFVPRPGDFERLDERFRLSPDVFLRRPEYGDFGFAVFQLKAARGWFGRIKRQTIHPMAFTFPTRRPKALFFPTLHIHDGHLPDRARFDHALYVQSDDALLVRTLGFEPSMQALGEAMNASRAMGLVDPAARAYRQTLHGERANVDHYYEPPRCRGVDVLDDLLKQRFLGREVAIQTLPRQADLLGQIAHLDLLIAVAAKRIERPIQDALPAVLHPDKVDTYDPSVNNRRLGDVRLGAGCQRGSRGASLPWRRFC